MKNKKFERLIELIVEKKIREVEQLENESELEEEIQKYKEVEEQIEAREKEIEAQLNAIKDLQKKNRSRFKKIQKFMERFKITKKKADKWVAQLEEVLKYKRIQPDWKYVALHAIEKLNGNTKAIEKELIEASKEVKRKATKMQLTIDTDDEELNEASIGDFFAGLWRTLSDLFKSLQGYMKIVDELPDIPL